MEFLSQKTDCSLFAFGSHSKKRPDNLVLGRMFDHHVYDMMEVGIENFKSIESLGGRKKASPQAGSKPCFAFVETASLAPICGRIPCDLHRRLLRRRLRM